MSEYAGDSVPDDDTELLHKRLLDALTDYFIHGLEDVAEAVPGSICLYCAMCALGVGWFPIIITDTSTGPYPAIIDACNTGTMKIKSSNIM